MKLATELGKRATGRTIYILDEPTTGLHFEDVRRLLGVLQRLVDTGNTVLVIEHNLDVIKSADWIIDLGPEGGDGGGRVVAEGTPEQVAKTAESHTGRFLAPILGIDRRAVHRRPGDRARATRGRRTRGGGRTSSPTAPTPSTRSRSSRSSTSTSPARARVLDVGCGEGQVARRVAATGGSDRSSASTRPTASSRRPWRAAAASRYARAAAERAAGRRRRASTPRSSCLVLRAHPDPSSAAVAEVARVLEPGGRFVCFLNHPLLQAPGSGWIDDHILDEQYWRVGPVPARGRQPMEEIAPGVMLPFVHRPLGRYVNAMAECGLLRRAHGRAGAAAGLPGPGARVRRGGDRSRGSCSSARPASGVTATRDPARSVRGVAAPERGPVDEPRSSAARVVLALLGLLAIYAVLSLVNDPRGYLGTDTGGRWRRSHAMDARRPRSRIGLLGGAPRSRRDSATRSR